MTPPSGSASRTFDLLIPANLAEGSQMQLTATAVDLAGNVSTPATLTLTTVHTAGVTLPSSQIVRAGESVDVQVELPNPAPAGGVRVDFTTDDAQIATATPSVQFAEGQTTAAVTISGIAGGNTTVRALIQGVLRATMTVTVSGGIVRGTVYDSQLHPVGGVQLTISGGGVTMAAISEPDGTYGVEGIVGPSVGVKALDPETRLRGFASGTMTQARGRCAGSTSCSSRPSRSKAPCSSPTARRRRARARVWTSARRQTASRSPPPSPTPIRTTSSRS